MSENMRGIQGRRVTHVLEGVEGGAGPENQTSDHTCFGSPVVDSSKHLLLIYRLTIFYYKYLLYAYYIWLIYIYLLYIQGRLKTYYIYTYMSSPLIVTKSLWEGQSYYRIRR